jgi:hypothetical protein
MPVESPARAEPTSSFAEPAHGTPTLARSSRDQLSAESALLDVARVAVAQGNGARALEAIERHRSQFPRGSLAEEREALAVKSLHILGRDEEARSTAARFEKAYPKSLFLPAIRNGLDASH